MQKRVLSRQDRFISGVNMNRRDIEDSSRLLINQALLEKGFPYHMRDIYSKSICLFIHSNNVAFIASQMAFILGLDIYQVKEIIKGSLLHDIGKIYVPEAILNKPERLTQEELDVIHEHPTDGFKHIQNMGYSDIVLDIVLHHHETENGTGYPDMSTDMRLETKIVAIADKFDAISATRPYHKKQRELSDTINKMETFRNQFSDSKLLYRALYGCHGV